MQPNIPLVDIEPLVKGDAAALRVVAGEIGRACRDVGFFYIANHGVEPALIDEAFAQSHAFFALPLADKRALGIETEGGSRGYLGSLHEALDPTRGADLKARLDASKPRS